jgi:hypothetical protein
MPHLLGHHTLAPGPPVDHRLVEDREKFQWPVTDQPALTGQAHRHRAARPLILGKPGPHETSTYSGAQP